MGGGATRLALRVSTRTSSYRVEAFLFCMGVFGILCIMKVYMDVCCLNRPFDDQNQDRVRIEAEAILNILEYCQNGVWTLAASKALDFELAQCPDPVKLAGMRTLYAVAQNRLTVTEQVKIRSRAFRQQGLSFFDSLHVALAEAYQQDVFLTTDDRLYRAATALRPGIRVENPVIWFMEVTQ